MMSTRCGEAVALCATSFCDFSRALTSRVVAGSAAPSAYFQPSCCILCIVKRHIAGVSSGVLSHHLLQQRSFLSTSPTVVRSKASSCLWRSSLASQWSGPHRQQHMHQQRQRLRQHQQVLCQHHVQHTRCVLSTESSQHESQRYDTPPSQEYMCEGPLQHNTIRACRPPNFMLLPVCTKKHLRRRPIQQQQQQQQLSHVSAAMSKRLMQGPNQQKQKRLLQEHPVRSFSVHALARQQKLANARDHHQYVRDGHNHYHHHDYQSPSAVDTSTLQRVQTGEQQQRLRREELSGVDNDLERLDGQAAAQTLWTIATILRPQASAATAAALAALAVPSPHHESHFPTQTTATQKEAAREAVVSRCTVGEGEKERFQESKLALAGGRSSYEKGESGKPDDAYIESLPLSVLRTCFHRILKRQLVRLAALQHPLKRPCHNGECSGRSCQQQPLRISDIRLSLAALVHLLSPSDETHADVAGASSHHRGAINDTSSYAKGATFAGEDIVSKVAPNAASFTDVAVAPATESCSGAAFGASLENSSSLSEKASSFITLREGAEAESGVCRAFFVEALQQLLCPVACSTVDQKDNSSRSSLNSRLQSVDSASTAEVKSYSGGSYYDGPPVVHYNHNSSSSATSSSSAARSSSMAGSRSMASSSSSSGKMRDMNASDRSSHEDPSQALSSGHVDQQQALTSTFERGNVIFPPDMKRNVPDRQVDMKAMTATTSCNSDNSNPTCSCRSSFGTTVAPDIQQRVNNNVCSRKESSTTTTTATTTATTTTTSSSNSSRTCMIQNVETVAVLTRTAASLRCVSVPLLCVLVQSLSAIGEYPFQAGVESQQQQQENIHQRNAMDGQNEGHQGTSDSTQKEAPLMQRWLKNKREGKYASHRHMERKTAPATLPSQRIIETRRLPSPHQLKIEELLAHNARPYAQVTQEHRWTDMREAHQEYIQQMPERQKQKQQQQQKQQESMQEMGAQQQCDGGMDKRSVKIWVKDLKGRDWKGAQEQRRQSQQHYAGTIYRKGARDMGKEDLLKEDQREIHINELSNECTITDTNVLHPLCGHQYSFADVTSTSGYRAVWVPLQLLCHIGLIYCSLTSLMITCTSEAAKVLRRLAGKQRREKAKRQNNDTHPLPLPQNSSIHATAQQRLKSLSEILDSQRRCQLQVLTKERQCAKTIQQVQQRPSQPLRLPQGLPGPKIEHLQQQSHPQSLTQELQYATIPQLQQEHNFVYSHPVAHEQTYGEACEYQATSKTREVKKKQPIELHDKEEEVKMTDTQAQSRMMLNHQATTNINSSDMSKPTPLHVSQEVSHVSAALVVPSPLHPSFLGSSLDALGIHAEEETLVPLEALYWLLQGRLLAVALVCKLLRHQREKYHRIQRQEVPSVLQQTYTLQEKRRVCSTRDSRQCDIRHQSLQACDTYVGRGVHQLQQQAPLLEMQKTREEWHRLLPVVEQLARACVTAAAPAARLQELLGKWHASQERCVQQKQKCFQRQQQTQQRQQQHGHLKQQQAFQQHEGIQKECLEMHTGHISSHVLLAEADAQMKHLLPTRDRVLLQVLHGLTVQEQEAQRDCARAVLNIVARMPETAFFPVSSVAPLSCVLEDGRPPVVQQSPIAAVTPQRHVASVATHRGVIAATTGKAAEVSTSTSTANISTPIPDALDRARNSQAAAPPTAAPLPPTSMVETPYRHSSSSSCCTAPSVSVSTAPATSARSAAAAQASSLAWALSRMYVASLRSTANDRPSGRYRRALNRLAAAVLSAATTLRIHDYQHQCAHGQQQKTMKQLQHSESPQLQPPRCCPHGSLLSVSREAASATSRSHKPTLQPHLGAPRAITEQGKSISIMRSQASLPLTTFLGLKRCLNITFSFASVGYYHEAFFNQWIKEMLTLLHRKQTYPEPSALGALPSPTTIVGESAKNASLRHIDTHAARSVPLVAVSQQKKKKGDVYSSTFITVEHLVSLLSTLGMLRLQHVLLANTAIAALVRELQHRAPRPQHKSSKDNSHRVARTTVAETAATYDSMLKGMTTPGIATDCRSELHATNCSNGISNDGDHTASSCAQNDAPRASNGNDVTASCCSGGVSTGSTHMGAPTFVNNSMCEEASGTPLSDAELLEIFTQIYVALARLQHRPPTALQQLLTEFMQRLTTAAGSDTIATHVIPRGTTTATGRKTPSANLIVPSEENNSEPINIPASPGILLHERSSVHGIAAIAHSCAVLQCASPQLLMALRQIVGCWIFPGSSARQRRRASDCGIPLVHEQPLTSAPTASVVQWASASYGDPTCSGCPDFLAAEDSLDIPFSVSVAKALATYLSPSPLVSAFETTGAASPCNLPTTATTPTTTTNTISTTANTTTTTYAVAAAAVSAEAATPRIRENALQSSAGVPSSPEINYTTDSAAVLNCGHLLALTPPMEISDAGPLLSDVAAKKHETAALSPQELSKYFHDHTAPQRLRTERCDDTAINLPVKKGHWLERYKYPPVSRGEAWWLGCQQEDGRKQKLLQKNSHDDQQRKKQRCVDLRLRAVKKPQGQPTGQQWPQRQCRQQQQQQQQETQQQRGQQQQQRRQRQQETQRQPGRQQASQPVQQPQQGEEVPIWPMPRQGKQERTLRFLVWRSGGSEEDLKRLVGVFLWTFAACNDVCHAVYVHLLQLAAALTRRQLHSTVSSADTSLCAVADGTGDYSTLEGGKARVIEVSDGNAHTMSGESDEQAPIEKSHEAATRSNTQQRGQQLFQVNKKQQEVLSSMPQYQGETLVHQQQQPQIALTGIARGQQRDEGQAATRTLQTQRHALTQIPSLMWKQTQEAARIPQRPATDTGVRLEVVADTPKRHQQQGVDNSTSHKGLLQQALSRRLRRTSYSGDEGEKTDDHVERKGASEKRTLPAAEAKWFTQLYYSFLAFAADLQRRHPESSMSPQRAVGAALTVCGIHPEIIDVWKYNSCRSAHRPHLSQLQHRVKRVAEFAARAPQLYTPYKVEMEVPLCDQLGITVDIRMQLQAKQRESLISDRVQTHDTKTSNKVLAKEGDDKVLDNTLMEIGIKLGTQHCHTNEGSMATLHVSGATRTEATADGVTVAGSRRYTVPIESPAVVVISRHSAARHADAEDARGRGENTNGVQCSGERLAPRVQAPAPGATAKVSCPLEETKKAETDARLALSTRSHCGNKEAPRTLNTKSGERSLSFCESDEVPADGTALAIEVLGPSHFCVSATILSAEEPALLPSTVGTIAVDAVEALQRRKFSDASTSSCFESRTSADCLPQQQPHFFFSCVEGSLQLPQVSTSRTVYVSDCGMTTMQLHYTFDGSTALKQRLLRLSGKPCLFLSFQQLEKMSDEQLQQLLHDCLRNLSSFQPCSQRTSSPSAPRAPDDNDRRCNSTRTSQKEPPAMPVSECIWTGAAWKHTESLRSSFGSPSRTHLQKHFFTSRTQRTSANCTVAGSPCTNEYSTATQVTRGGDRMNKEGAETLDDACSNTSEAHTGASHRMIGAIATIDTCTAYSPHHLYPLPKPNERDSISSLKAESKLSTDDFTLPRCRKDTTPQCQTQYTYHWRFHASTSIVMCLGSRSENMKASPLGEDRENCMRASRCSCRYWLTPTRTARFCSRTPLMKSSRDTPLQTLIRHRGLNTQIGRRTQSTHLCSCNPASSSELLRNQLTCSKPHFGHKRQPCVHGRNKQRLVLGRLQLNGKTGVRRWTDTIQHASVQPKLFPYKIGLRFMSRTERGCAHVLGRVSGGGARAVSHSFGHLFGVRLLCSEPVTCAATFVRTRSRACAEKVARNSCTAVARFRQGKDTRRIVISTMSTHRIFRPCYRARQHQQQVCPPRYPRHSKSRVSWNLFNTSGKGELGGKRKGKKSLQHGVSSHSSSMQADDPIPAAAVQLQRNYEQVLLYQERLPLMLQWLHAVACWRQASLEKQGYAQPQLALMEQLQEQKRKGLQEEGHQSDLLLTPHAYIYAVVASICNEVPLLLLGACPSDQSPAFHFLQLAAAASTRARSDCRKAGGCGKGRWRGNGRFQGLLIGQSLRAGRYEHQRVDAWLSKQWDVIQSHSKVPQQCYRHPLVLYPLEALPGEEVMARLPFIPIAHDRLTAWEKIIASAGLPGSAGCSSRLKETHVEMQMLIPPPCNYITRCTPKQKE